jgi:hypothetical protein
MGQSEVLLGTSLVEHIWNLGNIKRNPLELGNIIRNRMGTWWEHKNITPPPKDGLNCDQDLGDTFLFLVVKVFDCLHQQLDAFWHQWANMTWSTKGKDDRPLSNLWTFYKHGVVARPFSRLDALSSFLPLSLSNLVHEISEGFRT